MAVKHKYLYLYLALACFLGIIVIFVFDGYMGVYDSLTVKSGEQEQKFEADMWPQQGRDMYIASASVERGGRVDFTYEIDNRWFSGYAADVAVSVWRNEAKVRDVIAQPMSVGAFGKGQMDWTVNTAELIPADIPTGQGYQFTMVIKRGEIERRTIIYVNPMPYPVEAIPQAPAGKY
jgi:hypothetical protein